MDENGSIYRAKVAAENAPKKQKADQVVNPDPLVAREYNKPSYFPLILPAGIWLLACVFLGFPAMYACRVNGQFIYYFRESLDLQALAKEYKYVAKVRKDEDEDAPPKTLQQVLVEAAILTVVCTVICAVGGMIIGTMSQGGSMVGGLLVGLFYGPLLTIGIGHLMIMSEAFKENVGWGLACWFFGAPADGIFVATHWEEGRGGCLVSVFGLLLFVMGIVMLVAGILTFASLGLPMGGDNPQPVPEQNVPGLVEPAGMEPAGAGGPAAAWRANRLPQILMAGQPSELWRTLAA
jgi:hypothetical protein